MSYAALAGVCGTCQSAVIPSSRATDGALTEYCGTCRIESLTTVRGRHSYDQRERLELELERERIRDTSPANPKFQHGPKMKAFKV